MQHRVFPPAHYVGNYTRRGPSLDFITPAMTRQMQEAHATASFKLQDATLTAQKATAMGLPTFYHLPYGRAHLPVEPPRRHPPHPSQTDPHPGRMYRYWAWGMTQYDEILYIDPDMWLIQPVDYFFNQLRTKVRLYRTRGPSPSLRLALSRTVVCRCATAAARRGAPTAGRNCSSRQE